LLSRLCFRALNIDGYPNEASQLSVSGEIITRITFFPTQ
jgi:hypothetical protein